MKDKDESLRTTVAQLQALLEAENAAAAAISGLIPMAVTPAMGKILEKLRDDEVWSCAGLTRVIKHLGGKASPPGADVAPPARAGSSLRERLAALARDQARVVKHLDRILDAELDRESGGFLRQMRALHAENLHRCDDLITALDCRACSGGGSPLSSEEERAG